MKQVEAEGISIDDAIEKALNDLGVSRDKADIEILANATKGIFGIGAKKAHVRATLRTPLTLGGQAEEKDSAKTGGTNRDDAKPDDQAASQKHASRPATSATRNSDRPANKRPRLDIDDDVLEHARTVLERSAQMIGTEATVAIQREEFAVSLQISGDDSGILIGRRGQTLDALEYVINRVASRDSGHTTRIIVDSHGYRTRRQESLEALAHRMGERAESRGKTVTMNPMSPRDRRIVHLALQDNPAVETRSSGKGYFRKLLIIPER